jgi:hypothetical protein
MTTLIIAGFIASLTLFAEISIGILDLVLDPIVGPLFLLVVIGILIPAHIFNSKIHAKFILKNLTNQQKDLNLLENIGGLFEKSLSFWRILLPITEPVGSNRKMRAKLAQLIEKNKEIIQSLNDGFSYIENEETSFYSKL